jgi:hypothetical protein
MAEFRISAAAAGAPPRLPPAKKEAPSPRPSASPAQAPRAAAPAAPRTATVSPVGSKPPLVAPPRPAPQPVRPGLAAIRPPPPQPQPQPPAVDFAAQRAATRLGLHFSPTSALPSETDVTLALEGVILEPHKRCGASRWERKSHVSWRGADALGTGLPGPSPDDTYLLGLRKRIGQQ